MPAKALYERHNPNQKHGTENKILIETETLLLW